jgi:hypothetical protein
MPKVHNIGPTFVQITNFPYKWGAKFIVRGWTQEIEDPFRTSKPFIVRLPRYKALVLGRWTGTTNEESALSGALQTREVTYDDFTEEKGWIPAPDSDSKESLDDIYSRLDSMDGTVDVHDWQTYYRLAKESEQ